MPPRTLGIDLASQPRHTAACVIDWDQGGPSVISVRDLIGDEPLSDDALLKLIEGGGVEKVAIDAPFGWPVEFVEAVSGWRERSEWPVPPDDPAEDQKRLVLRETDREVLRVTGLPLEETEARRSKRPLSVTTDKLAYTAMRCARILAEIGRREGAPVDRSGRGRIVEVYPDASLREWGLWPAEWDTKRLGYKGKKPEHRERRESLIDGLSEKVGGWIAKDSNLVERCARSDDELDALVSSLAARVVQRGDAHPVTDQNRAELEGWIHLPTRDSLGALFT